MSEEQKSILSGAKGVVREGRTVSRPAHPWSPNIAAFLRHLEGKGLPVERFIGIRDGRELTEYDGGELVHPQKWTDDALFEVGALTAALGQAAADFEPEGSLGFQSWYLREIGGGERIWCHGDLAPWNLLTEGGKPSCLVDWEYSGPLDPLVELARVCWLFPQLVDDDLQALYDLPSPEGRARQVRLICEGYGLEQRRRARLTEQILEVIICETAHEAIDPGLTFEDSGSLWGFAWRSRSLYWVWRNRTLLENALK